ncbi:hypothetical protein F7734_51890 [Scytonema sp. UIC 10036]|uniref:hypothetical protein n=1 Tax=Scytonema sp. UIC 10036 TaxID=2304196 RepID=UPI0012DA1F83|nr:hypothetical protein [Scytonema sp. UIC 10036]MUH00328.1 hypothetical protein [Scytonema sp. UIC 10036]
MTAFSRCDRTPHHPTLHKTMNTQTLLKQLSTNQYLPIGNISERVIYPLIQKGLVRVINTPDGLQVTKIA